MNPKDLEYEYPQKDNTKGELRYICDVTHVPSGKRARGRGLNQEMAKIAAVARLRLELGSWEA